MFDLYLLVDLLVVLALLALGLTILVKNRTLRLNQIFAAFVTAISVWIMANYISNDTTHSPETAVIANYFVFSCSYAASIFLLLFVIELAGDVTAKKVFKKTILVSLLIAAAGATPLVVDGASLQDQVYAVHFGPVAPVYFVALILNIVAAVYVTYRNISKTKADQKNRLRVIFKSLCWTFPVLIMAQAVLPATTGWFGLTNVGVLPMLILVYGLYYSVVKHRLFDLRPVIVRTMTYVMTLGLISGFYGITSFYLTTLIAQAHSRTLSTALNILLIICVVIAYAPLKKAFDKLTSRIFYQDSYDAQDLFDELNRTLVSSLDVSFLMTQSAKIIASHIKADFCLIGLKDKEDGHRIFGTHYIEIDPDDIARARRITTKIHQSVIMTDALDQHGHADLQSLLQKNNIAVLVRLSPDVNKNEEGLGYIVLGQKKSGNQYNKQDRRVLDAASNELIIAVQNALHFEEIQRFNETLQAKVEDATRRLSQSNRKLKKLNDTKDDFIGMASHQLRTPLTSVKGYLSLVLDGDAGKINDTQRQLLQQAFTSSQRVIFLVADLLNVSRLKTGKFVIDRTAVNLSKMILDEIAQLREAAASRGMTVEFTKPAHFPVLPLDEAKTRQVVMNFLDNAIYYGRSGGHIVIKLEDLEKSVELRVIDDGIGVPADEKHQLWTKFYRARNAQRARPDGTGLGLYMAKKVIVAQGGGTIFDSVEGKGSTFGFTFPKDLAEHADTKQPVVVR